MDRIGIIGGGAWGTALAQVAAAGGETLLWAREPEVVESVNERHENTIFLPGIAVYAGLRLAKPQSLWAKRFYGERRPDKQLRAEHRFRPDRLTERCLERLRDLIGGVTEQEYLAQLGATPTANDAPAPRPVAVSANDEGPTGAGPS